VWTNISQVLRGYQWCAYLRFLYPCSCV
jgi:hypothetical protein